MQAVLIGSAPYRHDPIDYDVLADQEWAESFKQAHQENLFQEEEKAFGETYAFKFPGQEPEIIEVTVPRPGTSWFSVLTTEGYKSVFSRAVQQNIVYTATLPVLACLLKAHLIKDHPKWERSIANFARLKYLLGVTEFKPADWGLKALFKQHRNEIKATMKKHPKLNQDAKAFFGDEPYEIFDHDSIHRALADDMEPAYVQMKGDDAEVWCDKNKWDALPHDEKIRCVVEESAILALERSVIPALFIEGRSYSGAKWAYKTALRKLCQTISSGWFRDYCIEHYDEALAKMIDINSLFFNGLSNGTIICKKPELVGFNVSVQV